MMMPRDEALRRFLAATSVAYAVTAMRSVVDRRGFEKTLVALDRGRSVDRGFWPSLGAGYLATIAAAAWWASRDRARAAELARPLMVAKAVTSGLFLVRFLRTRRLSYAAASALDGSLLGAMAYLRRS